MATLGNSAVEVEAEAESSSPNTTISRFEGGDE